MKQDHLHQKQQEYTCPMHPEIIQEGPGNCPKCGMDLVPVISKSTRTISHDHHSHGPKMEHEDHQHKKGLGTSSNKGSTGFQKYTCPMHPQIVQDEPGKCPICGMTLVPFKRSGTQNAHQSHRGGMKDFKKRFYVVLLLTIPIMLLS